MTKVFPRGVATLLVAGCLLPVFAKAGVESKLPPPSTSPTIIANPIPPDADDLAWAIVSLPLKPGGTAEDPENLSANSSVRYNTLQLAGIYVDRKIRSESFAALRVAHEGDCTRALKMLDHVQADCVQHHGASVSQSVTLTQAEVYYLMHDVTRAIQAYEDSKIEFCSSITSLLHYAMLLHQVHRDQDAIEYNQKVVDILDHISWGPREPDWMQEYLVNADDLKAGKLEYEANLLLTYQAQARGFSKEAIASAREALRLRPTSAKAHLNLGIYLEELYIKDTREWHTPAVFAEATKELQAAKLSDKSSIKDFAEDSLRLLQNHDKPAPPKSKCSLSAE